MFKTVRKVCEKIIFVWQNEVPQIVGEIYQKFFVESRDIPVEKFLLKEIQQSLVGNRGTQVFVKLQEQVCAALLNQLQLPVATAADGGFLENLKRKLLNFDH